MNGLIHGIATLLRMLLDPRQRPLIDWGEALQIANPATWQPADWALFVGLGVGFALIRWARRESVDATEIEREGQHADLTQTKQHALEALRHLDLEKDKLDPEEYERQRAELVARGAGALRALDRDDVTAPGPSDDAVVTLAAELQAQLDTVGKPTFEAAMQRVLPARPIPDEGMMSAEWRGAAYALATVALAVAMFQFASSGSRDRRGDESMTGVNMAPAPGPSPQQASMEEALAADRQRIEAALEENPNDIGLLNDLTQIGLSTGDLGLAQSANQRALEAEPTNKDARVFRAVLSSLVGMHERAFTYLDEVLAEDPLHEKALTYKGLIAMEAQRWDVAVEALEKAIEVQGEHPALMGALRRARQEAGQPVGEAPPSAPPAAGGAVLASGTATLPADKQDILSEAQVVFVSVADPDSPRPPLAAVKLAPTFPLEFSVTEANVIPMARGRGLPDNLLVTVRIDLDGNAFSQSDAEPRATATVERGSEGLELVLQ